MIEGWCHVHFECMCSDAVEIHWLYKPAFKLIKVRLTLFPGWPRCIGETAHRPDMVCVLMHTTCLVSVLIGVNTTNPCARHQQCVKHEFVQGVSRVSHYAVIWQTVLVLCHTKLFKCRA